VLTSSAASESGQLRLPETSPATKVSPLTTSLYNAALRNYEPTDRFNPVFEHSADRVLAWFRDGYGDSLDLKIQRTVPCEAASDLVRPDLETLAVLTRAIAGRKQVKVNYLSLTSGASTKTLSPLALADTGQRWHLRAYDCDRERFADFSITRIVKAKPLEIDIPLNQRIEADVQWARVVRLELVPHPGVEHPEAIEADYQMKDGMLVLGYASAFGWVRVEKVGC
jgi:predicted DNA-binding transcriptional regulator YafY